jgi:UDP-glucose:(heptosyl)LPS alpha-1,3-glucosyltransferase
MVRDDIGRRFGVPAERMHVVYNAVNSDAFHPGLRSLRTWVRERHHISDAATLYLLVGSGYARKGVAQALKAMVALPPTTHLMIIGRDRALKDYAKLARELGVADRVTFAGPQSEPKPYYGAADVFVLPTLYDPLPNAALEAMACGLPVITSTTSGTAELVLERGAGLVCDALDVPALASHMRTLQDTALRSRMGEQARAMAVSLTPAAMTLQLVLLYRDLLESTNGPRASAVVSGALAAAPTPAASTGTQAVSMPELGGTPLASDGAAELPMSDAVIVPATGGSRPIADERPPELGDGLPGRDPRAG